MDIRIHPGKTIKGSINVPGDKSISHRSVMLGAIAKDITEIEGFLMGEDCLSTISCFKKMGIDIRITPEKVIVKGNGMKGLKAPESILDVGNSGTTIRLIMGILSAQNFTSVITGDSSIQKRPMDRVAIPLKEMGAKITGKDNTTLAPLTIEGAPLKGIEYTLPVASAQVKSSIILAGIYAQGKTIITEPSLTRDHTEIMLSSFGASISREGSKIIINPAEELTGQKISVPGDISSAAYFIAAASILEGSDVLIKNVGVNPTRTGIIKALKEMGADISLLNERNLSGEAVADIQVKYAPLKGIALSGDIIPLMIDEIPVFAVAALFAEGKTIIKDAQELKVKESNRIAAMVTELKKMSANIEETPDGMIIEGGFNLKGASMESYNDHRIAMSLAIAALKAQGESTIINGSCTDISFPGFYGILENIITVK